MNRRIAPGLTVPQARVHAAGFTLPELVVTITIGGILLAMAASSYRNFILNSRRAATINELVGTLQFARGEALKRGTMITVCPSANPTAATPTCAAVASGTSNSWSNGWLVYVNNDASTASPEPDAGETVFRVTPYDYPGMIVTTPDSVGSLSFRSFNMSATSGTITICDS